jgi:hypothetical protein
LHPSHKRLRSPERKPYVAEEEDPQSSDTKSSSSSELDSNDDDDEDLETSFEMSEQVARLKRLRQRMVRSKMAHLYLL